MVILHCFVFPNNPADATKGLLGLRIELRFPGATDGWSQQTLTAAGHPQAGACSNVQDR